jgi:hypothetical protein
VPPTILQAKRPLSDAIRAADLEMLKAFHADLMKRLSLVGGCDL